jgi:hypothetical protein
MVGLYQENTIKKSTKRLQWQITKKLLSLKHLCLRSKFTKQALSFAYLSIEYPKYRIFPTCIHLKFWMKNQTLISNIITFKISELSIGPFYILNLLVAICVWDPIFLRDDRRSEIAFPTLLSLNYSVRMKFPHVKKKSLLWKINWQQKTNRYQIADNN